MKSLAEFRAGFNQCATEVNNNLNSTPNSEHVREKLMTHLASSCHGNHPNSTFAPTNFPANAAGGSTTMWVPYPSPPPSPMAQNFQGIHRDILPPISPLSPVHHATKTPTCESKTSSPTSKPALWRPW